MCQLLKSVGQYIPQYLQYDENNLWQFLLTLSFGFGSGSQGPKRQYYGPKRAKKWMKKYKKERVF